MPEDWSTYIPIDELRILLVAVVVAFILAVAARLFGRLTERVTRTFVVLRELAISFRGPMQVLLPLMGVQVVLSTVDTQFGFIDGLRHFTALTIIAMFTWAGLRAVMAMQRIVIIRNPVDMEDNLRARRVQTLARVLVRVLVILIVIVGAASMLMTFPTARHFGTSLLASAGLAGLAISLAAQPVLGNMIAGLQIAITQPIRLDDVVIVDGEWGRIEEITGTYVVVRVWDSRRLVVPLRWFIENPFQNWTRRTSSLLGSVFIWMDYSVPLEPLRRELERLCVEAGKLWDGQVCVLQVTDCSERAMQIRILASSGDSSMNWDLRCFLRENLLLYVNQSFPGALPKLRIQRSDSEAPTDAQTGWQDDNELNRQPPV